MANTKHSTAREIIIDRLLRKRRGYSVYEILDIVNESLNFEGFGPVSITTIRRDLDTIRFRYKQKLEAKRKATMFTSAMKTLIIQYSTTY